MLLFKRSADMIPLNYLNIGVWNIHGLFTNINNFQMNKSEDPAFQSRVRQFDILCLQETHCGPKHAQSICIEGYKHYLFHRTQSNNNRYIVGSLLIVKNEIKNGFRIIKSVDGDKVWLKLDKKNFNVSKDIFICFTYVPPMTTAYYKNLDYDIFQELESDISFYRSKGNVILAGDFNAKTNQDCDYVLDLQDEHSPINENVMYNFDAPIPRKNRDKHAVDTQGVKFLELCKSGQLRILNGRTRGDRLGHFTRLPLSIRESPSTLDYFATDIEIMQDIRSLVVLSHQGLSDHECLLVSLGTKGSIPQEPINPPIIKDKKLNYASPAEFLRKINSPIAKEKIRQFLEEYQGAGDETSSLDSMTPRLVDILKFLSESTKKTKHRKKNAKNVKPKSPWYSSECQRLKNSLNRATKEVRKDPFNRKSQDNFFSAKKSFKKVCRESERKFRDTLTAKLLSIEKHKPTEFWNLVKKIKTYGKPNSETENNIHPSEWLKYFEALLTDAKETPSNLIDELKQLELAPSFSELDSRITTEEVEKALSRLNKKSSPGPDKIHPQFLVLGKGELKSCLGLYFNKLFTHTYHPYSHSLNYLKPIYKKGDPYQPDNYRGIAIGSALAKTYELILLQRLENVIAKNNPISHNQIGFKKCHRTADHIFLLKSLVDKIVKTDRKKLFVAFIDFRKAYDKVNRTVHHYFMNSRKWELMDYFTIILKPCIIKSLTSKTTRWTYPAV